jgi:hypothetical protein
MDNPTNDTAKMNPYAPETYSTQPAAQPTPPPTPEIPAELKITSIYLAGYLLANSIRLIRTEPADIPRLTALVFDGPTATPLVASFRRGGTVSAKKFSDAIMFVKSLLFHGRR